MRLFAVAGDISISALANVVAAAEVANSIAQSSELC
jgi:hypothetical protein